MNIFFLYQGSDRAEWAKKSCEIILSGEAFEQCRSHDGQNYHEDYYTNCVEQACRYV